MISKDSLSALVQEIRAVCDRYGVALIGSCYSESIHGEIDIVPVEELSDYDKARGTEVGFIGVYHGKPDEHPFVERIGGPTK